MKKFTWLFAILFLAGSADAQFRRKTVRSYDFVVKNRIYLGSKKSDNLFIAFGTGDPEGNLTAARGSTFHRTDGSAGQVYFYKDSGNGNTGWIAVGPGGSVEAPSNTFEKWEATGGTSTSDVFFETPSNSSNVEVTLFGNTDGLLRFIDVAEGRWVRVIGDGGKTVDGKTVDTIYNDVLYHLDSVAGDWKRRIVSDQGANSKYFENGQYLDTTYLSSLSPGLRDLTRKSLLGLDKLPSLPYSIPVPDTVFSYLGRNGWKIELLETAGGVGIGHNIDFSKFREFEFWEEVDIRYVDVENGHNDSTGLAKDKAWKSIQFAMQQNPDVLLLMEGNYYFTDAFNNQDFTTDMMFINGSEKKGGVNIYPGWSRPFNEVAGLSNTFEAASNSVVGVIDFKSPKDADSTYNLVNLAVDSASVETAPNSYFFDNVTNKVYFHPFDSRDTIFDGEILLLISSFTQNRIDIPDNSPSKVYFDGIDFYGTTQVKVGNFNSRLVMENCRFLKSPNAGGFNNTDLSKGEIFLNKCEAFGNNGDGFGYANSTGSQRIIELDCIAHSNAQSSSSSVDGSSTHDQARMVRVGGSYYNNGNYGIHDVEECRTWNIGIRVYSQQNLNVPSSDIYCGGVSSTDAKIWNTLVEVPLGSTSSNSYRVDGSGEHVLKWCYPATTGLPSLGNTVGNLIILK